MTTKASKASVRELGASQAASIESKINNIKAIIEKQTNDIYE